MGGNAARDTLYSTNDFKLLDSRIQLHDKGRLSKPLVEHNFLQDQKASSC